MASLQIVGHEERYVTFNPFAVDYFRMKAAVIMDGGWPEIRWQASVSLEQLTEQTFLRELTWVVLSSGLSVRVVADRYPRVVRAFGDFSSISAIVQDAESHRRRALSEFGHEGKVDAVLHAVARVGDLGIDEIGCNLQSDPISFLRTFPYLGPATSRHLAKNLGVDVAKPDRHLVRLAKEYGYESVQTMCTDVAAVVGDPISVVDLVMWRFRANRLSIS